MAKDIVTGDDLMIYGVDTSPLTLIESIRGHITDIVYSVLGPDEAGISLVGTEVKSLRQGTCSIKEAYIKIDKGEV